MRERNAYWRDKQRRRRPERPARPGVDPHTGIDLGALGDELKALMAIDKPCAVFSLKPFDAYTLIAALQGASRNPTLRSWQRETVLTIARQIQGQLVEMARAVIGPDSLVERTTLMGFDERFDVPRARDAAGEMAP